MILTEKAISFNEIERQIQIICNKKGCAMLKEVLEAWDDEVAERRDKERYRHKGKRRTTIKTVLGEVEYRRAMYPKKSMTYGATATHDLKLKETPRRGGN